MDHLDPKYIPPSDLKGGVPSWYESWDSFHKYMQDKYEIAKSCELPEKPVIAETGFRLGYSAHSFLSAWPDAAKYYAYDIEPCVFGITAVQGRFPNTKLQLFVGNSYFVKNTPGPVDFFHVDGAHCFAGCSHDLLLALKAVKPGGYILVDDYKLSARHCRVKRAVDTFINNEKTRLASIQYFDTWRGDFLFRKA